jgi:hypothetical protein
MDDLVLSNNNQDNNNAILNPDARTTLASRFFKLLCEKNSDAERTNQPNIFIKDDIWGTDDDLDGISEEKVMPSIIGHLKKLQYIVEHADGKISLTNEGKGHCGEKIILPESI